MIKVLILSDPNNTHTIRWVSSLSRYVEIFLYGLTAPQTMWYEGLDNVRVSFLDFSNKVDNTKDGAYSKLQYLKVVGTVKRIIRDFTPDIIHGHYASSYGLIAAICKNRPLIQSVWGSDVFCFPKQSVLHKAVLKFNLMRANLLQSSSEIMAKEIRLYNKNNPLEIVPFGVDFEQFKEMPCEFEKSNEEFIIGTAKSLYPVYGIDYLIRALKIFIDRNKSKKIKLVILGSGQEESNLKELAAALDITENVEFKGRVDNNSMPKYYNYFDVAAFLSNSESFGVSAIESLACNCPVVVSDAPGFLEVVKKGGIIVPKQNPEAAANAFQQLLDNPDLRKRLSNEGHEYMKDHYGWQTCVDAQVEIYKRMASTNKNKGVHL